jgi:hypothetical protein
MDAYSLWDHTSGESHMMPVSILVERLHDLAAPEEVWSVLEKGVTAHLLEIRKGVVETYFCPLR